MTTSISNGVFTYNNKNSYNTSLDTYSTNDSTMTSDLLNVVTSAIKSRLYFYDAKSIEDGYIVFSDKDLKPFGFKFKKALSTNIYVENNYFCCDMDKFEIHCYAKVKSQLKEFVIENLLVNWDEYVIVDISTLSKGAIKLRIRIEELLEKI